MTSKDYILYGMQASLYTGKARAYMRRNRISVTERGAGHPEFTNRIYPHMNRFIMPVIETPDGDIVQDGTDILDYLEAQGLGREPLYPEDPVTKSVAYLFELFGNEGLLRPAMHYRWNFDDENLDFIKVSFADVLPAHLDKAGRSAMFDHASGRMRKAATAFGAVPQTYAAIEASYAEFLALYNSHLEGNYFLLGNAIDTPSAAMFTGDAFPETLKNLMRFVGEEYAAEFSAHVDFADEWLAEQVGEPEKVKAPLGRGLGFASFKWRERDIRTVVMPYRFYLAQRLWDHFDGCSENVQKSIRSLFAHTGVEAFLDKRPSRRVSRQDYHEVWAG